MSSQRVEAYPHNFGSRLPIPELWDSESPKATGKVLVLGAHERLRIIFRWGFGSLQNIPRVWASEYPRAMVSESIRRARADIKTMFRRSFGSRSHIPQLWDSETPRATGEMLTLRERGGMGTNSQELLDRNCRCPSHGVPVPPRQRAKHNGHKRARPLGQ